MKSITKEFEGMYGNGKPLNVNRNSSINNMLKRIPNRQYESNVSNYEPSNVSENKIVSEPPQFPYGWIIFFLVLVLLWVLYYFRENILNLFKGTPSDNETYKKIQADMQAMKKEDDERHKKIQEDINSIKSQEETHKKTQESINAGGVKQLDDKLNTVSAYKQEQLVKENSYCYIGTENGERECTNAYAGDVCMSGQIFPKMAICVNPRLRN